MAKTHSNSKAGIVGIAIIGATILASADTFIEKVSATGKIAKESACVVQDAFGGVLSSNLLDCKTVTTSPASAGSSIDGD